MLYYLQQTNKGCNMPEKTTSNPLETYSRGLLRSAVCTVNNQLRVLISKHFPNYEIVKDSEGHVYLTNENCNNYNFEPYGTSLSTLNDLFFYSPQNMQRNYDVVQAYSAFGNNRDIRKTLIEADISADVPVQLDPHLKYILLDNENNTKKLRERVDVEYNEGKLTLAEAMKRKKKKFPLKGEDYRQYLINNGFEGKDLEKMINLINVFNYSVKYSRLVDFLDIYGLYHYYLFRHGINVKFNTYINACEKAGYRLSEAEKKFKFEQILQKEVYNHCLAKPNPANHYFYHGKIKLNSEKIDVAKAKSLTLEVKNMTSAAQGNIKEKIEHEINDCNTYDHKISVRDFFIQPKSGLIKKDLPRVKPFILNRTDNSPRVVTVVNSLLLRKNLPDIKPDDPNELREILSGAKVVSESRRCGYYRDRNKKPNEHKEEPKPKDDRKQLNIFDDTM